MRRRMRYQARELKDALLFQLVHIRTDRLKHVDQELRTAALFAPRLDLRGLAKAGERR